MKYCLLTAFLLFVSSFTGECQNNKVKPVPGTRLLLTLPAEFRYDRGVSGFVSDLDSSIIFISEIDNPYSFDELIQKRIANILSLGGDTSNFKTATYDGYKCVQFSTNATDSHQKLFVLSFGSDDFLVDISILTSSERLETLQRIVLNGKYNKNLIIDADDLLGFTASFKGTNLKVFKKDANTLNTKDKDENGNVVSWLNLTRMPNALFPGSTPEETIDATYQLYRFDKIFVRKDTLLVDNSGFLGKLYTRDHETFQEYTIIGVIRKVDFYLLVMGGANNTEKLDEIYNIVRSIKFKNAR